MAKYKSRDINETSIKVIDNIYDNGTALIRLHEDKDKIKIGKGLRHEGRVSPQLFTDALERSFCKAIWEVMGVKIKERIFTIHDDIFTKTYDEFKETLRDRNRKTLKEHLKMRNRTKDHENRR